MTCSAPRRDRFGDHPISGDGQGGEREEETKPYEFGDVFDLDVKETLMNAVQRDADAHLDDGYISARLAAGGTPLRLRTGLSSLHRGPSTSARSRRGALCLCSRRKILWCIAGIRSTVGDGSHVDMSRSMPLRGYFYAAKRVD